MKPLQNDQLVTVMGGVATSNTSWISPLPDIFNSTKATVGTGKKPARGATSWLR